MDLIRVMLSWWVFRCWLSIDGLMIAWSIVNSRRQPLNGYYLGALLFITFQRIWILLGRFFTTRRGILEKSFFKSILLEWILKQKMKHVKKIGVILLLNKMKIGAKRVVFCLYWCFLEIDYLRFEKNSVSEQNFLFTCGILELFFV